MTDHTEATLIKRRAEAIVTQALMNARQHGGDNAAAAMDILIALILMSAGSGGNVDAVLARVLDDAKATVADFWPTGRMN